jgi:hypothetical protein
MAHTAKLSIQKEEFNLFELNYEFFQPMNENGQPAGKPYCGKITLVMAAPDNNNLLLHEWMASATEHKDGTCTFSVVDTGKTSTKTMKFYHAYCTHLKEYIKEKDEQMLMEITLHAKKITFGEGDDVVFGEE